MHRGTTFLYGPACVSGMRGSNVISCVYTQLNHPNRWCFFQFMIPPAAIGEVAQLFKIRPEQNGELAAISEVNALAFKGESEAKLVEAIRASKFFVPELSLVAAANEVMDISCSVKPVPLWWFTKRYERESEVPARF